MTENARSHFDLKQTVAVAVRIELAGAAAQEAALRLLLRVELQNLHAVGRDIREEGDEVLARHGMVQAEIVLVFHTFRAQRMRVVRRFRLQRRQPDAAAAEAPLSAGAEHVAAHGADVKPAAQEIGRAVPV